MSSFIIEDGNFISFKDYCLTESIRPKKVEYGTNEDFDNRNFVKVNGVLLTSFIHKSTIYTVILAENSLGFHGIEIDRVDFSRFDYLDIALERSTELRASHAISVFSNVFYIVKEMINKYNIKTIEFDPENPKLGTMYKNLMKNKYFMEEFESLGFRLTINDSKYIFTK